MNTRQRIALDHPLPGDRFVQTPASARKKVGSYLTVLDVRLAAGEIPSCWCASVSRGKRPVRIWDDHEKRRAIALLAKVLDGVGADDFDAEGVLRAAGRDPDELFAIHRWKVLSRDELESVGDA